MIGFGILFHMLAIRTNYGDVENENRGFSLVVSEEEWRESDESFIPYCLSVVFSPSCKAVVGQIL